MKAQAVFAVWNSRTHLSLARHQHSIVGHVITRAFRVSGSWSRNVTSGSWPLPPEAKAKAAGSIRLQETQLGNFWRIFLTRHRRGGIANTRNGLHLTWRLSSKSEETIETKEIETIQTIAFVSFLWVIPVQTHKQLTSGLLVYVWPCYQIMLHCQLCAGQGNGQSCTSHRPAIRALLHVRHVEHIGWNRLNHQTVQIVRPDVIRTLRFLKTTVTSFFRPSLDFAETAKISELILCFRLETRWRSWSLFRPLDHIYNSCEVIGKLWQCAWTPAGNYRFGPPFEGGTANIDSEGEGIMLPSISVTALGQSRSKSWIHNESV